MRCDDIRELLDNLWEGEETAEIRQHLTQCASCSSYHRDLRLLRAGLQLWKHEGAPEPSLGFAERMVRQIGKITDAPTAADFFERVGRRFVYATLVLAFVALLALALPSGPVRGLSAADIQIPTQEVLLAYSDPMGDTGVQEAPELAPVETPAPAVTDEVK